MAKKTNQVEENENVEKEPVVANENNVTDTEENEIVTSTGETTEEIKGESVEAPKETDTKAEEEAKAKAEEEAKAKAETEQKQKSEVKLKVLVAFKDKYTKQDYTVDDIISVNKERAKELLSDERILVQKLG